MVLPIRKSGGNHYLGVQEVGEVHDERIASGYGLRQGDAVVMIHCGSRGLGHQIDTEFLRRMVEEAPLHGLRLPDRELACAPIHSDLRQEYLGAMRAAINCALANRQILTHLVREVFADLLPRARLPLLYDVSHTTPARRKTMSSTAACANCSCTARARRAPGGRGMRTCPLT